LTEEAKEPKEPKNKTIHSFFSRSKSIPIPSTSTETNGGTACSVPATTTEPPLKFTKRPLQEHETRATNILNRECQSKSLVDFPCEAAEVIPPALGDEQNKVWLEPKMQDWRAEHIEIWRSFRHKEIDSSRLPRVLPGTIGGRVKTRMFCEDRRPTFWVRAYT
jgi:hypothetical protein